MKLNELSAANNNKKGKRLGRGIGSGKGKTAGRGHKGQKARSGSSVNGFEGGQMPIYRRVPKRGFNNIFRVPVQAVNLDKIQSFIDNKKLDASKVVNSEALYKAGLINKLSCLVKILGNGELKAKLNLEIDAISASAKASVEKAGGKVTVIEKKKKEKAEAAA